jgi:riboflavin synthase
MKIGVADTCFARVDMFRYVNKAISDSGESVELIRYTVPGIKDLPVACKKLLKECDIAIALGMPGGKEIDRQCAHEASLGLMHTQLMTEKHIIEVFVHLDEGSEKEILQVCKNRTYKHTLNAIALLKGSHTLQKYAGKGLRQGFDDEGPI